MANGVLSEDSYNCLNDAKDVAESFIRYSDYPDDLLDNIVIYELVEVTKPKQTNIEWE